MAKDKKPLVITLRFKEIQILSFEITQRVQELENPLPSDSYEFRFDLQSETNEQEKLFSSRLMITLLEKQGDQIKIELAKLLVLLTFEIINYEDIFKKENNIIKVPNQLIALSARTAISTARGILLVNLKDTKISNAIIPIIDPQIFFPDKKNK